MTTTNEPTTTIPNIINIIAKITWYISVSLALPGGAIALGIILRRLLP